MLRLLDLFCCAGGAAAGYHAAGFFVVGIDQKWQPNYPFFMRRETLFGDHESAFISWARQHFDAIHASPDDIDEAILTAWFSAAIEKGRTSLSARCRNALEDLDDEISALHAAHEAACSPVNVNNEAHELHLKLEGLEAARAIFAKHAALNPIGEEGAREP
jgi:hypothetical protein